jgi:hypothetical protein
MATTVTLVLFAGLVANYPIGGRFIAFLLPLVALGLGEGIAALSLLPSRIITATSLGLAVLILAPPALKAVEETAHPPKTEQIKPLLGYIDTHWRAGDTLYVSANAQYALRYYLECRGCDAELGSARRRWRFSPRAGSAQTAPALLSHTRTLVVGAPSVRGVNGYLADIKQLRQRGRVWLLFTHYWPYTLEMLTSPLQGVATQLDVRRDGVAAAYLYDFSLSSAG